MLTIDGSFGEGGGQIVRSSLALSLVTGKPFVIERVRAGRQKPGLMQQHVTAVRAAAQIGHADVEGATIGSQRFVFRPGEVGSGAYHFRVGSAGSTTLVLQTILPALLLARDESHLTLEGGTHNPFAPPFDFLAHTYLPLVSRLGPKVAATLKRPGFYPAGGGCMTAHVVPADSLGPLELRERGPITSQRVLILLAHLPRHIAEREQETIAKKTGWDEACFCVEEVDRSPGPGNAVMIELHGEHVTEVFTSFGRIGVRAEQVAASVLKEANRYLAADVPVGEHLADQLLLPLAIGAHQGTGGGTFRTIGLSTHFQTHVAVIRQFLSVRLHVAEQGPDDWLVQVTPAD